MLTTLLLVTLLGFEVKAAITQPQPREWPCPVAADLDPCVCTTDADLNLYLDCSDITSTSQLQDVFTRTIFPFSDFMDLTINPAESHNEFTKILAGTFGLVTFQNILISNTLIDTIEEEALVYSHSTLGNLEVSNNNLQEFPFETLYLFEVLRELRMANNKLNSLPDIQSETLILLDLSGNLGLTLTPLTFGGATHIEEIWLREMGLTVDTGNAITDVPKDVFANNLYLSYLDLSGNEFSFTIIESFINPPTSTLDFVGLNGNDIVNVHPLSITGLNDVGARVQLRNNKVTELCEDDWSQLMEQLDTDNSLDLRDNPLRCGCDTQWLVQRVDVMKKINNQTACATGNLLHDLPADWFVSHCPDETCSINRKK
ncbi:hypothetical protein Pcinc_001643 [Petrolisthes cinctipes]|uniref:Oplophorus-luciferin 2-monooxygenase non-catalytic subunit n=1 Tax=Petrolisthes cinctipes TaxID=88211 RepID=A0AAE1L5V9_PETCI|nr:hypothetical protein Pcinc_001643 [Petrolisthes cinctipes]